MSQYWTEKLNMKIKCLEIENEVIYRIVICSFSVNIDGGGVKSEPKPPSIFVSILLSIFPGTNLTPSLTS